MIPNLPLGAAPGRVPTLAISRYSRGLDLLVCPLIIDGSLLCSRLTAIGHGPDGRPVRGFLSVCLRYVEQGASHTRGSQLDQHVRGECPTRPYLMNVTDVFIYSKVLSDQQQLVLRSVLEEPVDERDNAATIKAKTFFKSCMDIRE